MHIIFLFFYRKSLTEHNSKTFNTKPKKKQQKNRRIFKHTVQTMFVIELQSNSYLPHESPVLFSLTSTSLRSALHEGHAVYRSGIKASIFIFMSPQCEMSAGKV